MSREEYSRMMMIQCSHRVVNNNQSGSTQEVDEEEEEEEWALMIVKYPLRVKLCSQMGKKER